MSIGMAKHRKSGFSVNAKHFTGKKGGKASRRAGETRKQRSLKHHTHVNKYKAGLILAGIGIIVGWLLDALNAARV